MFYSITANGRLEQGDVLRNLPKVGARSITTTKKQSITQAWSRLASALAEGKSMTVTFTPENVVAVVLSQSCDLREGREVVLAELRDIDLKGDSDERVGKIVQILRQNTRYHYFPPIPSSQDMAKPMLLHLTRTFQVPFEFIMTNLDKLFVARIRDEAREVLKNKIAGYFSRIAFDDVMYLSDEEAAAAVQARGWKLSEVNEALQRLGRSKIT